ncbi:MAG: hypothetical protein AAF211_26680, partial [Myxococcota bacterium]
SARRVDYAKLSYARRTRYRMRDPADVLYRVLERAREGGDPADFGTELARLQAITPDDVAGAFAGCTGHEVVTVEGPQAPIRASMQETGEAIQVMDWTRKNREWLAEHAPSRLK